jgi:hypothetical protein
MRNTLFLLSALMVIFISGTSKPGTVAASPIDGEWELVWSKSDGKVNSPGKPTQFKMFHNGFFSLIMQDSAGSWNIAGAGTFDITGNTYKETFNYVSMPDLVGYSNWQEYELKGDTLYFKLFKKVTDASGKEVTDWPKDIEEKRVRAKRK